MNFKSPLPCLLAGATGALLATSLPLLIHTSSAETRLLPFQGRLTDAKGDSISDGPKVVEFKIYDAPTGGTVKWAGEVHKLSVNGGLVNTLLGSKASLGSVDFSTPTYLQITIDAQSDGQSGYGTIDASDPPLLPRQNVQPSVYAFVAGQIQYSIPADGTNPARVAGKGWEAVFENGNPETGRIPAAKLSDSSITPQQLSNGAVTSEKIADGTIAVNDLSAAAKSGIGCVGDIQASLLTLSQFQSIRGNSWVLLDGSNVTGSAYQTLTGNTTLPDGRGMFLRGKNNSRSDGKQNPDGDLAIGAYTTDKFASHTHKFDGKTYGGDNGDVIFNAMGDGGFPFYSPVLHPTGGNETAPKSITINYFIKIN